MGQGLSVGRKEGKGGVGGMPCGGRAGGEISKRRANTHSLLWKKQRAWREGMWSRTARSFFLGGAWEARCTTWQRPKKCATEKKSKKGGLHTHIPMGGGQNGGGWRGKCVKSQNAGPKIPFHSEGLGIGSSLSGFQGWAEVLQVEGKKGKGQ